METTEVTRIFGDGLGLPEENSTEANTGEGHSRDSTTPLLSEAVEGAQNGFEMHYDASDIAEEAVVPRTTAKRAADDEARTDENVGCAIDPKRRKMHGNTLTEDFNPHDAEHHTEEGPMLATFKSETPPPSRALADLCLHRHLRQDSESNEQVSEIHNLRLENHALRNQVRSFR
jgi:hypothetical protein